MAASGEAALDLARCEDLVARATTEEHAWRALVEYLWPFLVVMVRQSRAMGPLAKSEDHYHNVVAELVDKLGSNDGRALSLYAGWRTENPTKTFADWLNIVTAYTVRDYVRKTLGRRKTDPGEVSVKRLLNEFATSAVLDEMGSRPPMTAAQTARQLLEFGEKHLPADQLRALTLWLRGADFEEIEAEVGCAEADGGRKLVRAAVGTLRRRFVGG